MSTKGHESEAIRVEGAQRSFQKFKNDLIGIPNISEAVYYTQSEANAHNALLTGALDDVTPLTAEQAAAYNQAVVGASKVAGDTLTTSEANAYNATLKGAVGTSDIKTPATPRKVKDYVDDESNQGIGNKGTCTTASATAAKEVTFGTTFSLVDGATAIVRFNYGISAENATLAVTYTDSDGTSQTTAAKPIYYRGAALTGGLVQAKDSLLMKYDGTVWNIVGSLGQNTDISYDTNNKKLTKNINGSTSDVVTAAKIVADGGGILYKGHRIVYRHLDAYSPSDKKLYLGYGSNDLPEAETNTISLYSSKYENDAMTRKEIVQVSSDGLNVKYGTLKQGGAAVLTQHQSVSDNNPTLAWGTKSKVGSVGSTELHVTMPANPASDKADASALTSHTDNTTVHITATERTAWNSKQDTITDRSFIGDGSAVCSTDAATQEKAVTITNFVLLKYGFVSVRFQKGVKVSGATLKINDNAAKAILIDGVALPAGVIRENVTALMQYDGTNFNIVSINAASVSGDGLLVDLGLPSGLKWATRNIDVTQPNGFAASSYQHECSFFSWGNTDGHNPVATNSFGEWSWGNSNDVEPYVSSPGHDIDYAVAQQAGLGYDAAHVNLGGSWKMPTTADFAELFNAEYTKYIDANGDEVTTANNVGDASYPNDKRVVVNGCVGLYLESKVNGKRLFFPASGFGNGASWNDRGAYGYYWSSSLGYAAYGRNLYFNYTGVLPQYNNQRFLGFTVRPVQ